MLIFGPIMEPTVTPDDATGAGGDAGGTQTPDGFVPKAEYEKAEAQRRDFQANLDKTTQENARLTAALAAASASKPVDPPADQGSGFDLASFKAEVLNGVYQANSLANAAEKAKADFPLADPAIFDRLSEFGTPEAFRNAVEVSHTRVQGLVDAKTSEWEKTKLAEFEAKYGPGSGNAPAHTQALPGDPTPQQLNAMSNAELDALEAKAPGTFDRVLRSASS